jgi:hypothetical protein
VLNRRVAISIIAIVSLLAIDVFGAQGTAVTEKTPFANCLTRSLYLTLLREFPSKYMKTIELGPETLPSALEPQDLALLKPTLTATNLYGQRIDASIKDTAGFDDIERQLRGKGFWIIFNPSRKENFKGNKVGHFSLLVDGMLFSRSFRDGTPRAANRVPWERRAEDHDIQIGLNSFLVAQFFEADPETIQVLKTFSTERVKNLQTGKKDTSLSFNIHPYSKEHVTPKTENCATFCFSWAHPAFFEANPELSKIGRAMGKMVVAEKPNVQLGFNTSAPSNRGTVFITSNPEGARETLQSDQIANDPFFHQLLIDKPMATLP